MGRINFAFALGLCLLLAVFVVSYQTMREIIDTGEAERHIFLVQAKINDIRNPLKDAEAGQRGFLLTGQETYLKKYGIASHGISKQVAGLASLLKDVPSQKLMLDRLKALVTLKFHEMDLAIAKMREGDEDIALELFFRGNNSNTMDNILTLLDSFDRDQENALHEQAAVIALHTGQSVRILVLGSAMAFSIVFLATYYFFYERRKRIKTEKFLRTAQGEAVRASHAKSEFLANVSHEIRTPLNGIISTADLFENSSSLAQSDKNFVRIIRSSGESLLRIVNDILDFSKMEAGKLSLEATVFSPAEVVRSATELFQARALEKGLRLRFVNAPSLPNFALGDAGRITQVLANFIGNALKFTEHGDVTVAAESLNSDGDSQLRFSVTDTGPGVDPEIKDQLFLPFEQGPLHNAQKFGGTGLGLAISKKLVDLMQGRIAVESDSGHGARFYFDIPMVNPDPSSFASERPDYAPVLGPEVIPFNERNADAYLFSHLLVLVAEDNATNQIVIKEHLRRLGIPAHVVANGREALQAFKARTYDLIFMDCQMPEMDGFEASQAIKKINADVPIVAMTASALAGDKDRCMAAGMTTQLIKPVRRGDIEFALNAHLPLFSNARMDWQILKTLAIQTSVQVVKKVVETFLQTLPLSLAELERTANDNNLIEVGKLAHRLKSGTATVGALSLTRLCDEIEKAASNGQTYASFLSQLFTEATHLQSELRGWKNHIPG